MLAFFLVNAVKLAVIGTSSLFETFLDTSLYILTNIISIGGKLIVKVTNNNHYVNIFRIASVCKSRYRFR